MAQKFRKVDPRIWNDENFTRLTVEGKLLALWMLAGNRVNRCGIVLWSPGLASEETGISRDRIDTVCHTVCDTLNWAADMAARTVFLTRWWRYNPPDNKSALEGALKDLHDIPKNNLKDALLRASEDISHGVRHLYIDAVHTVYPTVGGTVSPQKQEQEQEQKQNFSADPPKAAGSSVGAPEPEGKSAAKQKRKGTPNPLFDAVAEITASDPVTAGSYIGKVVAGLNAATPPYTPEDVREFGKRIAEFCPWLVNPPRPPTLSEVEKFIGKLRIKKPEPPRRAYDVIT